MKPYSFVLKLNINSCISFQSNYNPFRFTYEQDLYSYGSKYRKNVKQYFRMSGYVEDHHMIPKSLYIHPVIVKTKFPIHCSKNIKMMPSIKNHLVSEDILIHSNHKRYNQFIRDKLDEIYETSGDIKEMELSIIDILDELDLKLNHKDKLPWN
jgi:hypothetical protein